MLELILAIAALAVFAVVGLVATRGRRRSLPPAPTRPEILPGVGDDAAEPTEEPRRGVATVELPEAPTIPPPQLGTPPGTLDAPLEAPPEPVAPPAPETVEAPAFEVPEPTAGRLVRLRSRLSRSQNALGRGLLTLLASDKLDEDTWEDVETTLLSADVGLAASQEIVEALRTRTKVLGTRTPDDLRALLREELLNAIGTGVDRTLKTLPHGDRPAVVLVVGVNGTGKTTTCGKLARVLVADGRSVVLGAADTFRAAAADQLSTWAGRVGAEVVRGPEGGDPASVAFDAVKEGVDTRADCVLIDTAGRLHTKTGLMDELAKIKRVAERLGSIDEVLLVLDATTGQNGVIQAKQFAQSVDVTGVVLSKLDGTAKGGIVIAVQRELGIPVKLVGLGEGPDDLAPFDPAQFVDALLEV